MGELASIAEGNSPKFIKPLQKTAGRSYDPLKNIQDASIVTAIEILMRHGMEKEQALKFVSNETKLKTSTLEQMRKDFNRRKRMPKAFDFLFEQKNQKFDDKEQMKSRVLTLLYKLGKTLVFAYKVSFYWQPLRTKIADATNPNLSGASLAVLTKFCMTAFPRCHGENLGNKDSKNESSPAKVRSIIDFSFEPYF